MMSLHINKQQQPQDTAEEPVRGEEPCTPTDNLERRSILKQRRINESLVEKEDEAEFRVDLRIQEIAQDVILEDDERMDQIQKSGWRITNWIPFQVNYRSLGEAREIHQVQRRVESHNSLI